MPKRYDHTKLIVGIAVVLSFIFAGCSTPLPLSEMVMFHNAKNHKSNVPRNRVALTGLMNGDGHIISRYIRANHDDLEKKDILDPTRKAGGLSILFPGHYISFNFEIGYKILDMNATFRLVGRNYITLNAAALSGLEAILQRPILDRRYPEFGIGVAGGLYTRYDVFYNDAGYGFAPTGIASYGLRMVIQMAGSKDGIIHGFYSIGYAPCINHTLMFLGLAIRVP